MLLGGIWRLNDYYVWLSIRDYRIEVSDPALEKRLWDIFPSESLRFWPLFLRKIRDTEAYLERTLPVFVHTRITGMGTFVTDIKLLSPWVVVEWRGQLWCISREGRMWNVTDGSLGIESLKIPQRPLWRVPSLAAELSGDSYSLPKGVFPSLFSMEAIGNFLEGLGDAPWFGNIEEIVLDRRAGVDFFKLRYIREKQEFAILIQKDKYGWRELNIALEHVVDRLREEGGNHVIDATYQDKIVVRNLSSGAGEGSSR
jgi:hypothetical protein